jgi:hypothetical protein
MRFHLFAFQSLLLSLFSFKDPSFARGEGDFTQWNFLGESLGN